MLAVAWHEDAIDVLKGVRQAKEYRRRLQHKLIELQRDLPDEMGAISHEFDVTQAVQTIQERLHGLDFPEVLVSFATFWAPLASEDRFEEARKSAEQHLFTSLMPVRTYDREGKMRARTTPPRSGAEINDAGLRHDISRHGSWHRHYLAVAAIEPARQVLWSEHRLEPHDLLPLLDGNPFVPPDRAHIFATGLSRFLAGDTLTAAHLLIPQVENSLRHVLRLAGHDVVIERADGIQENRSLSSLLKNMRPELERWLTAANIFELEELLDFEGGPTLRHEVAHGSFHDGSGHDSDVVYACWFIFRLVVLWHLGTARAEEQA